MSRSKTSFASSSSCCAYDVCGNGDDDDDDDNDNDHALVVVPRGAGGSVCKQTFGSFVASSLGFSVILRTLLRAAS